MRRNHGTNEAGRRNRILALVVALLAGGVSTGCTSVLDKSSETVKGLVRSSDYPRDTSTRKRDDPDEDSTRDNPTTDSDERSAHGEAARDLGECMRQEDGSTTICTI